MASYEKVGDVFCLSGRDEDEHEHEDAVRICLRGCVCGASGAEGMAVVEWGRLRCNAMRCKNGLEKGTCLLVCAWPAGVMERRALLSAV